MGAFREKYNLGIKCFLFNPIVDSKREKSALKDDMDFSVWLGCYEVRILEDGLILTFEAGTKKF